MSENLPLLHKLELSTDVLRKTELLNLEIASLNKQILTNSSKKDEQQSNHAVRMMIFTFIVMLAVMIGIVLMLFQQEGFVNWFNLTFYGKTQTVITVSVIIMVAVSALVARFVGLDIMKSPYDNENKVKKLRVKKDRLTAERDDLLEENREVLEVLPEDYRRSDVSDYLHTLIARNPKLTLKEALDDYIKTQGI